MTTKRERFDLARLTVRDKLTILLKTKEILGPGGRNWIKGEWYGKRLDNLDNGWVGVPVVERYVTSHTRTEADCFCLEGAVYFAAYKLGYTKGLYADDMAADLVSLAGLIDAKDQCSVSHFNDHAEWKDIKQRLDQRIRQVRALVGKAS